MALRVNLSLKTNIFTLAGLVAIDVWILSSNRGLVLQLLQPSPLIADYFNIFRSNYRIPGQFKTLTLTLTQALTRTLILCAQVFYNYTLSSIFELKTTAFILISEHP